MSISTGPIFAKFATMVELWLYMNDLNLVFRFVSGCYHDNQFFFVLFTELSYDPENCVSEFQ